MALFSKDPKKSLGIDVGTTSIKVVELLQKEEGISLNNYGIASVKDITGKKMRTKSDGTGAFTSLTAIAETVEAILKEAKIKSKRSVFSIPDHSSFFTSFRVPKMKKSEVESAIQFQARQRVPLPLNEVTLDWQLTNVSEKNGEEMVEVLLLAVPNDAIRSYRGIAQKAGLEVGSLDAGAFGLARVYGEDGKTIVVVDVGDQTTTVNIIENEIPKYSHALDIAGKDFTEDIAILPEVDYNENEEEIASRVPRKIRKSLSEDLVNKVKEVCENYQRESEKEIDRVIITGGGANLEDVRDHFSENFSASVADPFEKLIYPDVLEPITDEISPLFSVAIGMALQGLKDKK